MRPCKSTKRVRVSQQLRLRNSNQRKSKKKSPSNSQRRSPESPSLLILNHLLKALSKLTTKNGSVSREVAREEATEVDMKAAEVATEVVIGPTLAVEVNEETEGAKVMITKNSEVEAAIEAIEVIEAVIEVEVNTVEEVKEEAEATELSTDQKRPTRKELLKALIKVSLLLIERKK